MDIENIIMNEGGYNLLNFTFNRHLGKIVNQ